MLRFLLPRFITRTLKLALKSIINRYKSAVKLMFKLKKYRLTYKNHINSNASNNINK